MTINRGKETINLDDLMSPGSRETFFNRRTLTSSAVGSRKRSAYKGALTKQLMLATMNDDKSILSVKERRKSCN